MRPTHLIAILVLLALTLPASPAQAGGVVSVCDESHLKAALSGGGTVTFTCSGTITLTSTITISTNTTIDGSGQTVTISGNSTVRVFVLNSGVTLSLNRVTVANGYVDPYDATPKGGGVLSSGGTLIIDNSTFSGNYTLYGAGIHSSNGSVKVSNSTFTGNYTYSTLSSSGGGSGIYLNGGTLEVVNSTFSGNQNDGDGGAVYVINGTVTVTNSAFSGNRAGEGGGIENVNGTITVVNSTFSGNIAMWSTGGGISTSSGAVDVVSSTFSGNEALANGGGIYAMSGEHTVSNSTFTGNRAVLGGGISSVGNGSLIVTSSTFSGNGASMGGASFHNGGTLIVQNTIAANSTAGAECRGVIVDGGGNLSNPDASCPGIHGNPLLGALQNNGGPTQTMALGAGSPAIDVGSSTGCQNAQLNNRDQRGYARFVDGNGDTVAQCDIGAFEYGASGPPTAVLDPDPPMTTIELTPAAPDGAGGWYRSPVTVQPQASDASPVIDLRCALDPVDPPAAFDDLPEKVCPFLGGAQVTAEGRHILYAAAADIWGNKSAPVSASFKIDMPPLGLTNLEMTVNREQAYAGAILEYRLMVRNLTGLAQEFRVSDPIPENTEVVRRIHYNPATNAVEWSGIVEPWGFKTFTVYVRIASGTPGGTAIVNTAAIEDDAATGSASAATIVKTLPPYRGHREDVDVNEVVIRGN